MSTLQADTTIFEVNLQSIELLKGSINVPSDPSIPVTNFSFNLNVESRVDASQKLIFIIVSVEIMSENNNIWGSISASCIFNLINFDELIKAGSDGKLVIPEIILNTLNMVSISTTRGIMFSTFKGTILHNAILPIINPTSLVAQDEKKSKIKTVASA